MLDCDGKIEDVIYERDGRHVRLNETVLQLWIFSRSVTRGVIDLSSVVVIRPTVI